MTQAIFYRLRSSYVYVLHFAMHLRSDIGQYCQMFGMCTQQHFKLLQPTKHQYYTLCLCIRVKNLLNYFDTLVYLDMSLFLIYLPYNVTLCSVESDT